MKIIRNLSVLLSGTMLIGLLFSGMVNNIAQAVTDNVTVTQAVTSGITISAPADITMTALTTSQNTAVGSAAWTVTTNNAADCIAGADVPSTTLKWRDFDLSGSADEIATASSQTSTSGTASTMCVATEQAGIFAASGTYTATITATALAL